MAELKIDPVKIDAMVASREAEAIICERMAEELENVADEKRREASSLRSQNAALIDTARRHGYPESTDSETKDA